MSALFAFFDRRFERIFTLLASGVLARRQRAQQAAENDH